MDGAPGCHDACSQALDVPFPGAGQRLVKVRQIEDKVALGCAEAAEVHEVAVAAKLDADAGRRRRGQVESHCPSRPTQKRERRWEHAAIAYRDQFGEAPLVRRFQ